MAITKNRFPNIFASKETEDLLVDQANSDTTDITTLQADVITAQATADKIVRYSTSLTPASVAANTTAEQTFTVAGLVTTSTVIVNKPTSQAGLGIAGVRVSAADTLAITFINATASPIVPTAESYKTVEIKA